MPDIIKNQGNLSAVINDNFTIRTFRAGNIRISLNDSSGYSGKGANLYLRVRKEVPLVRPLFSPESHGYRVSENSFAVSGRVENIEFLCSLILTDHPHGWHFLIELTNRGESPVEVDLIYIQDAGLKAIDSGLVNEYYAAQYLDRRILDHPEFGKVICIRQNLAEAGMHPWLLLTCLNGSASATTDGMLIFGNSFRGTDQAAFLTTDHPGGEYAGESPYVALRSRPVIIPSGYHQTIRFAGLYLPDHPEATSEKDLDYLTRVQNISSGYLPGQSETSHPGNYSLFDRVALFQADELNEQDISKFFGELRRFEEFADGKLLSFFTAENHHVVLKAKELLVDRPHGHILQAFTSWLPDESIMSTTVYMAGVFNSHVTQGNTNFNNLLSIITGQFHLAGKEGQRIIIQRKGSYKLLGVPSAFEMGLNFCRWIYKFDDTVIQIRTWAMPGHPQINTDFQVLEGEPLDVIVTLCADENLQWKFSFDEQTNKIIWTPGEHSLIRKHNANPVFSVTLQPAGNSGRFRPFSDFLPDCARIDFEKCKSFCVSITGSVVQSIEPAIIQDSESQFVSDLQKAITQWKLFSNSLQISEVNDDVRIIREIIPWFAHNALIHYLTPYGLEQFSGAAWGTRDVSQGPVELLLTFQKFAEARRVLEIIFSNQHTDGGWPQWWMFDRYKSIRAAEAHGDIVYWVILALCNYLKVTSDYDFLESSLPFFDDPQTYPVHEHIGRLIEMIVRSFIPGTHLVPYGGGDWNDSLQPVSHELSRRLISSWTVEMNYQAFKEYQIICENTGHHSLASRLQLICENIKNDFYKLLVRDGVVAGYGLKEEDGSVSLLLHPSDQITGVKYSLLPMERGILSGIFTPEQVEHHQQIIEKYLKGPDGARLMDRPLKYKGGIQSIFQRAESSTYFGREIGLMYVHEHIRYAESLAITGKADEFVRALRQAIPLEYQKVVQCGDLRQTNCYYSSSDVALSSRYEADKRYHEILKGRFTLKGGWRIYSSGPGIFISLIIQRLLGLRIRFGQLIIDPVLPRAMDGLQVQWTFLNFPLEITYHVVRQCHTPFRILANGQEIPFTIEQNTYRSGGAVVPLDEFLRNLNQNTSNKVEIFL